MPTKYSKYDSPYKEDADPWPAYRKNDFKARKYAEKTLGVEDRSFHDAMLAAGIQPSPNVLDYRQHSNLDMYGPFSDTVERKFSRAPAASNLDALHETLRNTTPSQNVEVQTEEERAQAKWLWNKLDYMSTARGHGKFDPGKLLKPNPPYDKMIAPRDEIEEIKKGFK